MNWTLFVEGPYDSALVRWLLQCLGIVDKVRVAIIWGGVSKLASVANEIHKSHNEGSRIAVLLDADSDVEHRRDELTKEIARLSLPIEQAFLLPDDTREGDLETLLEQLAPASHRAVYDCLDEYEACLRSLDSQYTTPNRKARVYAYCEAVGSNTGADKNYDDSTHWDRSAPGLEPLRQFLRGMGG